MSPSRLSRYCGARLYLVAALFALGVVTTLAGCTDEENPLAPYEGSRPLDLLRVTQNFTPEVQWVGGRVAAVGVNRGTEAALDSTLVWLQEAPGNDIGSYITVGENTAADLVRSFGGEPVDSLSDGEEYTFWIAERSAFDLALDSAQVDPAAFADTTFTMNLVLEGRTLGDRDLDVEYRIVREERLLESRYVVTWTPEIPFRRLAIRMGSSGGYDLLLWHILVPEGEPSVITPPVVIGEVPPGVQEALPFQGFVVDEEFDAPDDSTAVPAQTLWAVTDDWEGSFDGSPLFNTGYTQFVISGCNFDIDHPCP